MTSPYAGHEVAISFRSGIRSRSRSAKTLRASFARRAALLAALVLVASSGLLAGAAGAAGEVEIRAIPLGQGLAMLTGRGGNIGVSVGPDGVVLIDDQFADLTPKLLAAVRKLGGGEVRFVLNTHWHGDHTGGNEPLARGGAVIVAHHNVRERLGTDQLQKMRGVTIPAAPADALPIVTFGADVTLHLNGHEFAAFHVANAHTDGDTILHVRDANVLHLGDTYSNGSYPFIDLDTGGSLHGMIAAVDHALTLADAETKIIPGHGPLSNRAELLAYRDMLVATGAAVQAEIDAGRSLEETKARRPTRAFDAQWGGGFVKPEQMVEIVYTSLEGAGR